MEESNPPLLPVGSFLRERWEILKKIGGGGFGEIYKAKDHDTGQVRDTDFYILNSTLLSEKRNRYANSCTILLAKFFIVPPLLHQFIPLHYYGITLKPVILPTASSLVVVFFFSTSPQSYRDDWTELSGYQWVVSFTTSLHSCGRKV